MEIFLKYSQIYPSQKKTIFDLEENNNNKFSTFLENNIISVQLAKEVLGCTYYIHRHFPDILSHSTENGQSSGTLAKKWSNKWHTWVVTLHFHTTFFFRETIF
jgi:hypothetical protein